jgi:hypothetical protein
MNSRILIAEQLITKTPDLTKSVYSKYIISSSPNNHQNTNNHQNQPPTTTTPPTTDQKPNGAWRTVETTKTLRIIGRGKPEWVNRGAPSPAAPSSRTHNNPLVTIGTNNVGVEQQAEEDEEETNSAEDVI